MIYLIVYISGVIVLLLVHNILDEFDKPLFDHTDPMDEMFKFSFVFLWPLSVPLCAGGFAFIELLMLVQNMSIKLIRRIINMKFTFSLKEISQSIRKSFAPKEKVVKSKKKYSRKNKNWKKEI